MNIVIGFELAQMWRCRVHGWSCPRFASRPLCQPLAFVVPDNRDLVQVRREQRGSQHDPGDEHR